MATFNFETMTDDMLFEVFLKKEVKDLYKLALVERKWFGIISSKGFVETYLKRGRETQPQMVISAPSSSVPAHTFGIFNPTTGDRSSAVRPPIEDKWLSFTQPVHGVICCITSNLELLIVNPSTGQFLKLPRVGKQVREYLGYDAKNDQHKVLCLSLTDASEFGQVYTLGERNWRDLRCPYSFAPQADGIYLAGSVYFLGFRTNEPWSVISFCVETEQFEMIRLPGDCKPHNIIDFCGKVAVAETCFGQSFVLWVLEAQVWSQRPIVVHNWEALESLEEFRQEVFQLMGTVGNELLCAPLFATSPPFKVLCYDLASQHARILRIEDIEASDDSVVQVLFGHLPTPKILKP